MPTTLKQIAATVGLSQPAVSNILNAKAHLYRPETCLKVREAADRLGYRPTLRPGPPRRAGSVPWRCC